ncbi:MAG TPA: transposase [Pseudobdellovibrionaceae bacterium]|jgi:REP element-mobilizing transposase RayT
MASKKSSPPKNKKTKLKNKAQQLCFFNKKIPRNFGGLLLKGNAKRSRPLSIKEPLHLVLKSTQAIGSRSMLHSTHAKKIDKIIRHHAKQCRIRLYHLVNVGNHLHLVIKLDDRKLYSKFIRAITGLIARQVLKAERGPAKEKNNLNIENQKKCFWLARPFTRLIAWGRDYNFITGYMKKNKDQAQRFFTPWGFDVLDPEFIQFLKTG